VETLERAQEADVLERVAQYRAEYQSSRFADARAERERRRANGEVYFGGHWLPSLEVERVARALQRRELVTFVELSLLLALGIAVALGLCWLFAFLFLPE